MCVSSEANKHCIAARRYMDIEKMRDEMKMRRLVV